MCDATLANGPLTCERTDHHVSGHVFTCQHGSWVEDRHDEGGHG
ncbi:MAG: hypothetical protein WB441_05950 [Nocardioidaceae bacterium]